MSTQSNGKITREELTVAVSNSLRSIRQETKLTQEELANILGISKNTIVNIEKKDSTLSWPLVISIVTLFNQTPTIQEIIKGESFIEVIAYCSFMENKKTNPILYGTTASVGNTSMLLGGLAGLGAALSGLGIKKK